MNEALQCWREDFAREPDTAFDRLVRGVVPLGGASQLSFGEILDSLFEPGDTALDTAASGWLEKRILGPVPENTSLHRWVSVLEEYFRGIAAMELPQTGEILRRQHKRLRLWLHGLYEGPDRDPEGTYFIALARAQNDQQFSPLWRRLILGEELVGRQYLSIGMLGFRKMPDQGSLESSGVPEGLVQALIELADKPGIGQVKWKQTMRSLFATYRRSEGYWVEQLAPLLPHYQEQSSSRDWLSSLLPGIRNWRPLASKAHVPSRRTQPVSVQVSRDWAQRIRENPSLCDSSQFAAFLGQHRAYANTTGDPLFINKTFNNLSTAIVRADSTRSPLALSLISEALEWAPWNPYNWTSYAIVLCAAHRADDAIDKLWQARHRFAWDSIVRNELGRILRENGHTSIAESVFREAMSHFPMDPVCRCGLADLLIDLGEVEEAERVYRDALGIDDLNPYIRGGLARALSILSARTGDDTLREEAKSILQELADEGNHDGIIRLQEFDDKWQRASTDPTISFRRDAIPVQSRIRQLQEERSIVEMSIAERLGRAMVTLWQAERTEDAALRCSLCEYATTLLEVPNDNIDDDLIAAFVETRGLILLAKGDARGALTYFEEQIHYYGRGGWIGIQLGGERARIVLGLPSDADNTVEAPSSQTARFALSVSRVIHVLSNTPDESEVRDLLKTLYPRTAEFADRVHSDAVRGLSIENGAEMLGAFLQTRWFRPAGIRSPEDLESPEMLHVVIDRINKTRTDTFDVISNSTLAIAA